MIITVENENPGTFLPSAFVGLVGVAGVTCNREEAPPHVGDPIVIVVGVVVVAVAVLHGAA